MPPYVIYARKSTESIDRQVVSIESQIKELRLLAARQGIQVVDVLTESRSAKRAGRPVFGELMRRVHRGKVRGILCWKLDRLARNGADGGAILNALETKLLDRIVTIDRPYTPDGNDRFVMTFEFGMATKYSDDLSQNVKRGIQARLERGWINHRPRLGYLIDPATKDILADPDRFDTVQRMLRLVELGTMSLRLILKIANNQWHLTTRAGQPLSRSTFYAMLEDPFYAGIIQLRDGRRLPGAHPPMISIEEFRRIQEVVGRSGRPRPKRHSFTFTGILKCGGCGGAITAEEHVKKSRRRYVYYHCSRRRAGVACREPAVPEADLLRQLSARLRFLRMPDPIHRWLCREALAQTVSERHVHEQVRRTIENAAAGIDREKSNLVDLRVREQISEEVFLSKAQSLEERRESLKGRLHELKTARGEDLVQTFDLAARAQRVLQTGTPVQQRMILEAIGLNYTLKARKVSFSLDKPFDRIAEAGGLSNWSGLVDDVRTYLLGNGLSMARLVDVLAPQRTMAQYHAAA
jgi:DNA invertase Pin-like site-specific DNA recombinase